VFRRDVIKVDLVLHILQRDPSVAATYRPTIAAGLLAYMRVGVEGALPCGAGHGAALAHTCPCTCLVVCHNKWAPCRPVQCCCAHTLKPQTGRAQLLKYVTFPNVFRVFRDFFAAFRAPFQRSFMIYWKRSWQRAIY
jgi:hypothetical protein